MAYKGGNMLLSNEAMKIIEESIGSLAEDAIEKALVDFRRLHRQKDYLDAKEAARYVGVSYNTLQKLRTDGLKVLVIGGRTIYSKKLIEEYFEKRSK